MSITKQKNDFYWSDEREPHVIRREEILKKYPEVKKLFGVNPRLRYSVVILVAIQIAVALNIHLLAHLPYFWAIFIAATYLIGATIQHALFLAIHEVTHDLAFKKRKYNDYLAYIANIPIVFPYAMAFKTYHSMHHWEQGKDGIDTDIPTRGEARFFRGFLGKVLWFLHQIMFYAFRPMFVKSIKMKREHFENIIFQVAVVTVLFFFMSWWGWAYLLLALVLAGSLHPTSGHFISEHYVFKEGQETYSYYGPLNLITYNVGYHNEHHDFPRIPGRHLPKLKEMAPEYYNELHSYKSWTGVILKFLFDPKIDLYSRTKRK